MEKRKDLYRTYRRPRPDMYCFRVAVGETDLWIESSWNCREEAGRAVRYFRRQLKNYIEENPGFLSTLTPWPDDPSAPELVKRMIHSAKMAGTGPMAAVAGAINSMVGESLLAAIGGDGELLIENGGDLFLSGCRPRTIAVFAGDSPFSWKLGIRVNPVSDPNRNPNRRPNIMGVCTSAGTVGPSLSMGKADAAVILSPDPALADAVATATANLINSPADLKKAITFPPTLPGVTGALLICGSQLAAWGEVELVNLSED